MLIKVLSLERVVDLCLTQQACQLQAHLVLGAGTSHAVKVDPPSQVQAACAEFLVQCVENNSITRVRSLNTNSHILMRGNMSAPFVQKHLNDRITCKYTTYYSHWLFLGSLSTQHIYTLVVPRLLKYTTYLHTGCS